MAISSWDQKQCIAGKGCTVMEETCAATNPEDVDRWKEASSVPAERLSPHLGSTS